MKKAGIFIFVFFVLAGAVLAASKTEAKWMKNGQEMYAAKDYAGAAEAFEKVLAENPKNTSALTYAGYSYMYAGDKQAAIEKLEAAYAKTGDEKIAGYLDKLKGKNTAPKAKDKDEVKGGAARVAALGGAGIVLPDYANMMDLYASGFTSSYAYRENGAILSLSPALVVNSYKTEETDNDTFERNLTGFGANQYRPDELLLALQLFDGNSIIIKPQVISRGGKETTDDGTPASRDVSDLLWGGQIEIAQRFGTLAVGGMFGYDSFGTVNVNPGSPTDKTTTDISKMSYLGSVSYLLELGSAGITVAFNGGSNTPTGPAAPLEIQDLDEYTGGGIDGEYANLVCRYGKHTKTTLPWWFIVDLLNTTSEDITMAPGLDFSLGIGVNVPGMLDVSLYGGMSTAIAGERKAYFSTARVDNGDLIAEISTDEYDYYTNGMNLTGGIKARYFLSDLLVIGVAFDFMNLGVTRIPAEGANPISETLTFADVSGGVTVKIGGLLNIPVEGFYQSGVRNEKEPVGATDETWDSGVFGVRTGVEYMITRELAARLGFDYAYGGSTHKLVDSGSVTDNDPSGTAENPGKSRIGIGIGAGYKIGLFDINLGGRYIINGEGQLETGYLSKSSSDIEILTSVLAAF